MRWEYSKNDGKIPQGLKPAINRFDALMTRIAQLPLDRSGKMPLYHLLGKCLYSALDCGLADSVSAYLRPAEQMIATAENGPTRAKRKGNTRRVFIVHGRDEAAKEGVARYLAQLNLTPVILHEQPSGGKTVIEKFESHADVDFTVVLLTPDDTGGLSDGSGNLKPRARQNVIFELGFFLGRLERGRVVALHKGDVELPSDYDGVVFIKMDDAAAWKMVLAKEMKNAGMKVDLNKVVT